MGIKAIFKSGKVENYTTGLLDLLKVDKYVEVVIDVATGEILYEQEEN